MRNQSPRLRHAKWIVLAVTALALPSGCRQQEQPQPAAPPPAAPTQPAPTTTRASQPATEPASQPASQPIQMGRPFVINTLGLRPDRALSILSRITTDQPAKVAAALQSDHVLTLDTTNVDFLRIDVPNLPRKQAGRLVVRVDGQGLEVMHGDKIVYLQRNSAGNWSFGKPTPSSTRQSR